MEVIAEIGWNHMGEEDLAKKMISAASSSGANTVKFQYWNPQYLVPGAWDEDGRREIYEKAKLNEKKIISLKELAENNNVNFLISVFGTKGAELIKNLGIENIKIPSHETTNEKLIKFCSNNFKKIYFSAGASTVEEIKTASNILESGNADYIFMHCVSSYPCTDDKANLSRLSWLREFTDKIGFSDHTLSTVIPALSVFYGCEVIEKHFTTDKDLPGRDNKFALDPNEFKEMVINIKAATDSLINHGLNYQDIEKDTVENYRGRWEPHDYQ